MTVAPFVGARRFTDNGPVVCWNTTISVIVPFIVAVAGLFVPV